MQNYRKLTVWRRAHIASLRTDALTRRFPRTGYGWLSTQLRRSSESVPANIVEGCSQRSSAELARYLQSAIAFATETEHHLGHALDVGIISATDALELQDEFRRIQRMLTALAARVRGDERRETEGPSGN